jgi:ParB-like chromosome segregation protein Spo0J
MTPAPLAIEHVAPSTLKPAPYNPRQMDADERKRLERGITEFGLVDPIIARRSDHMVIGGHQRLASALALKLAKVPVVYLDDISDDRAAALNILLNNPAAQGGWDMPKLTDILSELDAHGFDATLTGFDTEELERLLTWDGVITDIGGDEKVPVVSDHECPKCGYVW